MARSVVKPHIATCVAVAGRGILIEGAPGSGKSALALALMDRGARLVGDDGVLLDMSDGRLFAHPHPRTRGLLEVRNLGLVAFEACDAAPIALIAKLDPDAPRYIDSAPWTERLGVSLPFIAIWPEPCPPALKVEQALRLYGLPA